MTGVRETIRANRLQTGPGHRSGAREGRGRMSILGTAIRTIYPKGVIGDVEQTMRAGTPFSESAT